MGKTDLRELESHRLTQVPQRTGPRVDNGLQRMWIIYGQGKCQKLTRQNSVLDMVLVRKMAFIYSCIYLIWLIHLA